MIAKIIPIIVFAVFGYYLMGGLFSAKLGMIDDHEIPYFLGSDGAITLAELPSVIGKTEIGAWEEYLRFRPSYYTIRVIETMLWGDNATLWFFTRYLLLVLSMWWGFRIMNKYFPKILSYLFIFYVLTMPFWPDLLTRLGPSEIYGIPALVGFAYGYVFKKPWILLASYTMAVGAKENFLFLLPLLLIWMWQMYHDQKMTKALWVGSALALGMTVWVVSAILVATGRAGSDIYGEAISYRYRITRFIWDIPKIIVDRKMYVSLTMTLIMFVNWIKKPKDKSGFSYLITMLAVYGVIASQYIFYPNQIPTLMRYDFPVMVLFRVADLLAISFLITKYKWAKNLTLITTATILVIFILRWQYSLIHNQIQRVINSTSEFSHKFDTVVEVARKDKNRIFVFVSQRFIDFEPVTSVARYLVARSVANRFEFKYIPTPGLTDPLGIHLESRMIGAMNGSNKEELFARFSTFSNPDANCYSVVFGAANALPTCPELVRF